jgi:hypothetical protein
MSRLLTSQDFSPHVGKAFRPAGQHRVLTLASIDIPQLQSERSLPRRPFILIFEGPPGDTLPEGSYDVVVDDGSEFSLYIAPIYTVDRDRQAYQAVFN